MRVAEAGHTEVRHRIAVQLRNLAVGVDRAIARIAALAVVPSGCGIDDDRRIDNDRRVDDDRRVGAGYIARRRANLDRRRRSVENDRRIARRKEKDRRPEKPATDLHGDCRLIDSASARANPFG
jgi:hypothetical protein